MGTELPPPNKGAQQPLLLFGPCVLWPNGCMDQDATWYGCRPRPRPRDVRWDLAPPNKGALQSPHFRPMSIVAMQTAGRRYRGIGHSLCDVVLDSPSTESGTTATPLFDPLCSGTVAHLLLLNICSNIPLSFNYAVHS